MAHVIIVAYAVTLHLMALFLFFLFFFFNDTAPTEIYTLSLHDALPICYGPGWPSCQSERQPESIGASPFLIRSEEHTSELQSQSNLVCRLLLEKKKNIKTTSKYRTECSRASSSHSCRTRRRWCSSTWST